MAFKSVDDLLSAYDTVFDGRWISFPSIEGAEIHLAHIGAGKRAIREAIESFREEHEIPSDATEIPEELRPAEDDAILGAMFGTVVKGWRGFRNGGGPDFEFSRENYERLCGIGVEDPDRKELAPLRSFVLAKSSRLQTFYTEDEERLEKN